MSRPEQPSGPPFPPHGCGGLAADAGPEVPRKRRRQALSPAQRALGLLVRREHSRQELARKLQARGVDESEASAVVERMAREGWQDDARFAASLARARAVGGYGPLRIRAELEAHGVAEEAISAALGALAEAGEDDWVGMAAALARRRHGSVPQDVGGRRKIAELLYRRGFAGDTVRRVLAGEVCGD